MVSSFGECSGGGLALQGQDAPGSAQNNDADNGADDQVRIIRASPGHQRAGNNDAEIDDHIVGGEDVAGLHVGTTFTMPGNQQQAGGVGDQGDYQIGRASCRERV